MKVVMLSNFYNAHQHTTSQELYRLIGDDYVFVQTTQMLQEQNNMRYTQFEGLSYIKNLYIENKIDKSILQLIENCDILISGGYNDFTYKRLKQKKITFIYSERLFTDSIKPAFKPSRLIKYIKRAWHFNNENYVYMLCSSAYLSYDLTRVWHKHKNMLKFGYFPYTNYEIEKKENNDVFKITWCGRMIPYKKPEHMIFMAKLLKEQNLKFHIDMIGDGILRQELLEMIDVFSLSSYISLHMPIPQEQILQKLADSDVCIQCSDYGEGWGAVVNEAMSVGSCIVASSGMGSAPYLIKNGVNGYIYKFDDVNRLAEIIKSLILNPKQTRDIGKRAKETIENLWNGTVAGNRLLEIFKSVLSNKEIEYYDDGPCSFAEIIKNEDSY